MIWHDARHRRYFISKWLFLAALLPTVTLGQTHVKQPFTYKWDSVASAERFELKLDNGAYVSVGLPPLAAGTHTLPGDPALTGSHSAEVRACNVALGCSINTSTVTFIVDVPAPIPAAPTNLRIVASVGPVESPSGTNLTAPGVGSIIDSVGAVWTLGPKDPLVDGGVFPVKARNGVVDGSAEVLCYSGHAVNARGSLTNLLVWWKWIDNAALPLKGSWSNVPAPAGCL